MAWRGRRHWRSAAAATLWVGIAIGAVTNIASVSLPWFIKGHQSWFWLVLLVLGVLATYLTPGEEKSDGWTQLEEAPSASPPDQERKQALTSVREYVTKGLDEKLGSQKPLDLTLMPVPGVLRAPAQSNVERASSAVPWATILDAYESARSEPMVVLGASGAGKSTLLLELAKHLLKEAERPDEPIPVVIPLDKWGRRRPSIRYVEQVLWWRLRQLICWILQRRPPGPPSDPPTEDLVNWLLRQVNKHYGMTPGNPLTWLKNRQLVLLLDGLDECAEEARDRFITEFKRLRNPRVVLCCRTPDFEKLADRSVFRVAWKVQPLTRSQVEQALAADLKNALHEDDDLWRLLSAPIWLSFIRQLNHWPERVRDHLVSGTDRGRELLDAFLKSLSGRTPAGSSLGQMLRWVAQLARLAGAADDPDSVDLSAPTRGARTPSSALFPVVIRAVPVLLIVPFTLAFVLPLAQLYGLASAGHAIIQAVAYVGLPILAFLAGGLVPGYDRASVPTRRKRRHLVYGAVLTGVVLGMLGFGLVLGFHALAVASMDTVRWVLVGGFALPAAVLLLRSRNARLRGLAAGLAALSVASLFVPTMAPDEFTYGVAGALQGALLMLPLLAVLAARGLSFEGFRLTPAMLVVVPLTVGLGLVVCLIPWVAMWLSRGRSVDWQPLETAMFFGWVLAAACLTGLVFVLRERVTAWAGRLFLALGGRLPRRLWPLLRSAESSGLFIKSAAGYRFAHPLMRQHLAEMDVLDLRPLTEPDPGLRQQVRTLAGQVITQQRALAEPPVRFSALLSDETEVHELAQKLVSPGTSGHLEVIDGPPGSGRSTLLLDLADELINQPAAPVPLILPASVWDAAAIHADSSSPEQSDELGQRTFTRLLLRAVDKEYGLPPDDTRQLLFQGQITLLLDDGRLTWLEALRFLHLLASFHKAYPKVGLALTADLAVLPEAVRDDLFGPQLLNAASTTRIMPLGPGILTSTAYAGYTRPLTEFGFPSEDNASVITTFSQLHRLVEAAQAALESHRPLADIYLANALALEPGEQSLRRAMQKVAWLRRADKRPAEPPLLGIRSPRWTLTIPQPLARAEARCTTPMARGLVLAIGGAYAIAPRFGTSIALLGSLILILLDITWQGWPGRAGLGGAISLRQRCAALALGAALGFALGWAAFELRGPFVHFVTRWTTLEQSLLLPLSAGIVIAMVSITAAMLRPAGHRLMFWIAGVTGLGTAAALYFAGPRPPEVFFEGFAMGVTVGAALCLVLCLKVLFTWTPGQAFQPWRPLTVRVAITLTWYGALCAAASWGHPGGPHLWPIVGLALGYCCSARLLVPVMLAPAGLIYGPALWFLTGSSGFLPWRLAPALQRAQARGWILPGGTFYDPLVRRFLASEAEQAWSLPAPQLFPHGEETVAASEQQKRHP